MRKEYISVDKVKKLQGTFAEREKMICPVCAREVDYCFHESYNGVHVCSRSCLQKLINNQR